MDFSHTDLIRPKDYKPGKPVSFLQEKADGIRITIIRDNRGDRAITRNGISDYWKTLMEVGTVRKYMGKIPSNSVVDCELHSPGQPSTNIKTLLNDRDSALQLVAFAAPYFNGRDCTNCSWETIRNQVANIGYPCVHTHWISDMPRPLKAHEIDQYKKQAIYKKIEGYVAKLGHWEGWWKIKPVRSVDAVVTGYEISESDSFDGGLKAIEVGVYTTNGKIKTIASVGSGFLASYRMSCKPKSLIGRVCEVSYDQIAGQGRLRFPRFIRWRTDKTPEECTADQLL